MIRRNELKQFLSDRDFRGLFIELGWDAEVPTASIPLQYKEELLEANCVAEKHGFVICVCDAGEKYPTSKVERRRFVNQLSKQHYEHLLIFLSKGKQCWTLAIRPQNRPMKTVEVEWGENQDIQVLMQKLSGVFFDISEEEKIGLTDVVDKVRNAFMENSEKVTRSFYKKFQKELKTFADFIDGIEKQVSKDWYAALMLNRLMFIYFIQKRGFLDNNLSYLEDRLKESQKAHGTDKFYGSFYRHFLRHLFAKGLGTPEKERGSKFNKMLGKVPYLNGGLFDVHQIENDNEDIDIPDEAFENLFKFFGQYNWHLDSRATATGKDINPDVIGYIFERYINARSRSEKGAYYTQEDITSYISRNTIIPFLLNRAKENCKNAFDPKNGIWRFLRENPDRYIYDAVKKGCDIPDEIPANIRRGIDKKTPKLLERRKDWNTPTEERFALPTETWRETIARRERYFELKKKMEKGGICEIDDLITYNLDIERFASDVLYHYEGSDFIAAFYGAIAGKKGITIKQQGVRGITVLDPACGSGAFLFAALNILEPLYGICIERMEDFVEEDDQLRKQGKRKGTKKHPQFRAVLEEISTHPNQKYWIYKTIILNNLYGVDLMKEAAEIAKLRLFLKLAAEAEYDSNKPNFGLEPLPDIDYNIRSGNSLVGFASMGQFEEAVKSDDNGQSKMDLSDGLVDEIRQEAEVVQKANEAFRDAQDVGGSDYQDAKRYLSNKLDELNDNMNRYLASEYGVDISSKRRYEGWLHSHEPFHWLTEFYGILREGGGFDVVIGNPPYVGVGEIGYQIPESSTYSSADIYGYFLGKSADILNKKGYMGQIVMHSIAFSRDFRDVRYNLARMSSLWFSFYGRIPSGLFNADTRVRNSIVFARKQSGSAQRFYTSRLRRWNSAHRHNLFPLTRYSQFERSDVVPMFNDEVESLFWQSSDNPSLGDLSMRSGDHPIFFNRTAYNWISTYSPLYGGNSDSSEQRDPGVLHFNGTDTIGPLCLLFSGRMFFAYWLVYGDEFHVTKGLFLQFNLSLKDIKKEDMKTLNDLAEELKHQLPSTIQFKINSGRRVGSYNTQKLWHITDNSDMIFLRYMTKNPELVFESIRLHVEQTVMTER